MEAKLLGIAAVWGDALGGFCGCRVLFMEKSFSNHKFYEPDSKWRDQMES